MQIGLIFWILMLIWLVFFIAWDRGFVTSWGPLGNGLFLFILLLLLGWASFGAPIRG